MGGVIARATFIAPNYLATSVNTILTVASPHVYVTCYSCSVFLFCLLE